MYKRQAGLTARIENKFFKIQLNANPDGKLGHLESLNSFNEWSAYISEDRVELMRQTHRFSIARYIPGGDSVSSSSDAITAPMPGKIIALNVAVGDSVSKDDALVVMEAMKMEQTLTAPRDGVVAEVGAEVGELVADGALLIRLEEEKK